VTVTGVDDAPVDGNVSSTVVPGTTVGADPLVNGLDPADVLATNIANDAPVTKSYVVNDGSPDRAYEYTAAGASVESHAANSGNTAHQGSLRSTGPDQFGVRVTLKTWLDAVVCLPGSVVSPTWE
jgi:hypothetical protein